MPENKKIGSIKKYLDNTFGEEGLKTDVKITLTNETLIKIIVGSVVATSLSSLAFFVIKRVFSKN